MKPVYSSLRKQGHANVAYIDDSLLQAESFESCMCNIVDTVTLFDSLGLTVHPDKSILYPTQCITFLGFLLNSVDMTVKLTDEKVESLVLLCRDVLKRREVTIRTLAQLIGKMVACEPAVPHAPLFYKSLEHEKDQALKSSKGDFEGKVYVSSDGREQISWWIDNVHLCANPVYRGSPNLTLETDSSKSGWGGLIKGTSSRTGGHWSYSEQNHHINYLELFAAFLTLQCFCGDKHDIHVRIYMDNTVAVNYLSKMGGKKDMLHHLARRIWLWCLARNIWLSACYLPGVSNTEADRLSRTLSDDMEWKLDSSVFRDIVRIYGQLDIDLFASRLNAQLSTYVSFLPDPTASAVDAFSLTWTIDHLYYAFPPFSLLGRVLQKLEEDGARMVLIAPL
ncbi:uncharacterized protein [Argopecten irradians]|uniref:uncharacterized protein n=1 Tax=Argopecten irradians TaxID=31199 RepID=UPI00371CCB13